MKLIDYLEHLIVTSSTALGLLYIFYSIKIQYPPIDTKN